LYKLNNLASTTMRIERGPCTRQQESTMETSVKSYLPWAAIRTAAALALVTAPLLAPISAQDRLKSMPGYERYQKVAPQLNGAVLSGAVNGRWSADGRSFENDYDGKRYSYDLA
jgi:hypothetical protein